ncbi:hypothetical protein M9Y10_015803 [Tritrichomonas musculus]|uniref:F5/8 type C domain-containing protein n=1 Tax=Tritrichomonas musculus TaxID=1915356 RepID=A0ABR2I4T5_9EUKA
MSISKSFQISPFIRNKKNLIYKEYKQAVDFDLLIGYSDFFYQNKIMYEDKEDIELSEEPIDISENAFHTFIKCCQNEKIEINESNVFAIRQLSFHYEVHTLQNIIKEYILSSPLLFYKSCVFNLLTNHEAQPNRDDEDIISKCIFDIIDDEVLLKLPIPTLYRILNNYSLSLNELDENQQNQIINFLFKYLQKYKKEASTLFLNLNLDKSKLDVIFRLNEEFSGIFDTNMIKTESLIKIVTDLSNDLKNLKNNFSKANSDNIQCLKNKFTVINQKIDDFLASFNDKINRLQKIDIIRGKVNKFHQSYLNEKYRNMDTINYLNNNINQMRNEIQNNNETIQNQQNTINYLKKENEKLNRIISDITPQCISNLEDDIHKFNDYNGETQKVIISKIIEQNKCADCQLFQKILDLLVYLSDEQTKNNYLINKNYIYIHPKNDKDNFNTIKVIESIGISSYIVESLYNNGSLTSDEFIKQINNYQKIYVEIGYNEYMFERIHEIIINIINTKCTHLKIGVNIFEFRSFEYFQNDKKRLYSVRIDSSVGDKISSGGSSKGRFENCSLVEILTIDDGIKYIEGGSFYSCVNLKYIRFGSSVEYIGNSAFNNCKKLAQISLPSSLNLIDFIAFKNCNNLNQIKLDPYKAKLRPDSFNNCPSSTKLIFISSLTTTVNYEFENYERFTHIVIPDSIKIIGQKSFKECKFLRTIIIPSSITLIEDEAFYKCSNLKEISFSSSLSSIGKKSFYGCSSLETLNIPSSIKSIGWYAFAECCKLEQIIFSCPSSLTEISNNLFENCSSLKQISIPSSVAYIRSNSFKGCKSLLKIDIPNSVKKIETSSFKQCFSISQITIPLSMNEINSSCFENSISISYVIFENEKSVRLIGQKDTNKCFSLKELFINSQTTTIPKIMAGFSNIFFTHLDTISPGIISTLHKKSKTKFDHLFVASQSSSDIYDMIDPNGKSVFGTSNIKNFFIKIELQKAVIINGIEIFSATSSFPKSFDIKINGVTKKSIKSADELNGENKRMKILFDPISCSTFRFVQKGPNWNGSNFLSIKRIEFLSSEPKYSGGVFNALVSSCPNKDPHLCPAIISSSNFDFNTFHSLNPQSTICTFALENSWFQIELTSGFAILKGFRIKYCNSCRIKSCKIICTDDVKKPIDDWTTLIEIKQTNQYRYIPDTYEFSQFSPPARYIRLIQTGPNSEKNLFLKFRHFDLFGIYI